MNGCNRFEDTLTEKIYDNIHGFILLTKEEKKLLSTSYFQRLNHIKQLGLSYFVFPGAVHTRFSHSLGVLHITEKLIQRLKKTGCPHFNDEKSHKILRLAALLHDIGHYPLSHTIEKSYMEYFSYNKHKKSQDLNKFKLSEFNERDSQLSKQVSNTNAKLLKLQDYCDSQDINEFFEYYEREKEKSEMNHETIAGVVIKSFHFKKLIKELFDIDDDDIDDICDLINGTNTKEKYFIHSKLIHSKFDADQMDYMFRDTSNTGINAPIDLDFIIKNMEICNKTYDEDKTDREAISFNVKSVQAIEQFILAKYYWYSSILYYDKSYIVNSIAQRIYTYLLVNNFMDEDPYKDLDGIKKILNDNPNNFFFFNDDYFWSKIKAILNNPKLHSPLIVKLSEILIKREFPEVLRYDFFEEFFNEKDNINYHSQILKKDDDLDKDIEKFKNKINTLNKTSNKYVGFCIQREIISVDNKKENYLENEDINIHLKNGSCKSIIGFPNQFLNTFIDKDPNENKYYPKQLYTFKVYDFQKLI